MTLAELLFYHASEGGLLDASCAFDLARDADLDTSGIDFEQEAETANGRAIEAALRGEVLGARLFKTRYITFAEMACGAITNGDIEYQSEAAFVASMSDRGIEYSVVHVA